MGDNQESLFLNKLGQLIGIQLEEAETELERVSRIFERDMDFCCKVQAETTRVQLLKELQYMLAKYPTIGYRVSFSSTGHKLSKLVEAHSLSNAIERCVEMVLSEAAHDYGETVSFSSLKISVDNDKYLVELKNGTVVGYDQIGVSDE